MGLVKIGPGFKTGSGNLSVTQFKHRSVVIISAVIQNVTTSHYKF